MAKRRHACQLANWGRNRAFRAAEYFEPATEAEVLELLGSFKGRRFRAVGSLHSWSEAAVCEDVVLNLERLAHVDAHPDKRSADIGAGCTVRRAIRELRKHGLSLPTLGMADSQHIAGAVSTATHGSGRSSFSHYITALRVAAYDGNGAPAIVDITGGEMLEAARCSVGRMGILVSLEIQCVPAYLVEETNLRLDSLDELLQLSREYPLTQFYLMPWGWAWFVQLRRVAGGRKSSVVRRAWYGLVRTLSFAILNGLTVLCARILASPALIRRIYRLLSRNYLQPAVVNDADRVLITGHRLRYVEMEVFVPADEIRRAAVFVEEVLGSLADGTARLSEQSHRLIASTADGLDALHRIQGTYVHAYPITFRLVKADSTMISMSSGQDMYAISFITFAHEIAAFEAVCELLAKTMSVAFGARPHWGKIFPLEADVLRRLYPRLGEFERECLAIDRRGAFTNRFTERVFGF